MHARITTLRRWNSTDGCLFCATYVIISTLFSYPLLFTIGRRGSTLHSPSTINLICMIKSKFQEDHQSTRGSANVKLQQSRQTRSNLISAWIQLQAQRKDTCAWRLHFSLQNSTWFCPFTTEESYRMPNEAGHNSTNDKSIITNGKTKWSQAVFSNEDKQTEQCHFRRCFLILLQ